MKTLNAMIAGHPFFRGMTVAHLQILAGTASQAGFEKGHAILHEGETAYQFYLIQQGQVAVETTLPGQKNLPVEVIGPGDVLGWSWLFAPYALHFRARALEPTTAIFLDGARLLVECEKDHDFGYELMKRMARVLIHRLQATQKCFSDAQATCSRNY